MANVKFVNNASTKLASALTSSGTTCTVLQGTGAQFPTLGANEFFVGVLVDLIGNLEVVYVTAQDTDTFTITRAQEGTAALAFPEGSFFENRLTAGSLTALQTQITGVDNWVKEEIIAIPGLVETATTAAEEAEASAIIAAAAVETTEDYMNSASSSATAALASAGLASGYADSARAEAQAASTSEAAAAASATAASTSETNAADSETASYGNKINASVYAASALDYRNAASTSASNASISATSAAESAADAALSESAAAGYKNDASISASAAAGSMAAAASSATSAETDAQAASTSASLAASSATASASSATSAEASAVTAQGWAEAAGDAVSGGLSIATADTLGGVKIGTGVTAAPDGTISVSVPGVATSTVAGTVKSSNSVVVSADGTATVPVASTTNKGIIELATSSEAAAGSGADKAMTPALVAGLLTPITAQITTLQEDVATAQTTAEGKWTALDASSSAKGIIQLASVSDISAGTDMTKAVTPQQLSSKVSTAISSLINSAPETLDTLNELAAALGDDPNFATTVANQIGVVSTSASNAQTTANTAVTDAATAQSAAEAAQADATQAIADAADAQETADTVATTDTLGRVKVNGGLSITSSGDLSISADVQEIIDSASALLDDVSINSGNLKVVRSNSSGKIESGYLPISDSVTSTSTTDVASSAAVKTAWDEADGANTAAILAQTTANAALPKAGGTMTGELAGTVATMSTSISTPALILDGWTITIDESESSDA